MRVLVSAARFRWAEIGLGGGGAAAVAAAYLTSGASLGGWLTLPCTTLRLELGLLVPCGKLLHALDLGEELELEQVAAVSPLFRCLVQ